MKKNPGKGESKARDGNLTKPVSEEWNFYLVPHYASKKNMSSVLASPLHLKTLFKKKKQV